MLQVKGLEKIFPAQRHGEPVVAVDGVDFTVDEGRFLTLLGPSGCGKTTTLRCLAGLEEPSSGEIWIGGNKVYSSADRLFVPATDRGIGMVFQSYAIWPHMSVFDNAAFPLRARRRGRLSSEQIRRRVYEVLERLGLAPMAERNATQLSGGQQQRLALARALATQPRLLLLDEPLSNLDAQLRESLRFELKRLQRETEVTTVYVTHDQAEALSLSNVVAVMHNGQISQIGSPDDIYSAPANTFVAGFVGTINLIPGTFDPTRRSGGNQLVATAFGDLAVGRVSPLLTARAPCAVSIRPEDIQVVDAGATSGANVLDGSVRTRLFLGEAMAYEIEVGTDVLRVRIPGRNKISTGTPVRLQLPVEHLRAIATEDTAAHREGEVVAG